MLLLPLLRLLHSLTAHMRAHPFRCKQLYSVRASWGHQWLRTWGHLKVASEHSHRPWRQGGKGGLRARMPPNYRQAMHY